jgi:hypothetical protein
VHGDAGRRMHGEYLCGLLSSYADKSSKGTERRECRGTLIGGANMWKKSNIFSHQFKGTAPPTEVKR